MIYDVILPRPHTRNPDLNLLTMQNFAKYNKDLLHVFVYVRKFKGWKVSSCGSRFKWPKNKENIVEANCGAYNYISLAFSVHDEPIILLTTAEYLTRVLLVNKQVKIIFLWYRNNVLLPFINLCRKLLYGHIDSEIIPEELTVVCWCDDANTQVASIVSESQQLDDAINRICTCKHSAARTAVKQALDCCLVFRSTKAIIKSITKEDLPHLGLQRLVSNEFKELDRAGILKLTPKKLAALTDFLS